MLVFTFSKASTFANHSYLMDIKNPKKSLKLCLCMKPLHLRNCSQLYHLHCITTNKKFYCFSRIDILRKVHILQEQNDFLKFKLKVSEKLCDCFYVVILELGLPMLILLNDSEFVLCRKKIVFQAKQQIPLNFPLYLSRKIFRERTAQNCFG